MDKPIQKILAIFGTRPEAIKLAPVIRALQADNSFTVKVCVTAQHREMLDQVLSFFGIIPDHDLNLMKPGQTLVDITADALRGLDRVIELEQPDIVMVQGDTTSAFIGALAGFYRKVKIAHIEAGLRSGDRYSPFPEEMNRVLASHLAEYHFAPTERAAQNLLREGITNNVWVVGNPVIDALHLGLALIDREDEEHYQKQYQYIDPSNRVLLVTGHRRESFGGPFEQICTALREIADTWQDVEIVYPVHLNPNVREPVNRILEGHDRIHLIEPLPYPHLLWLMRRAYLVITDSGGIQEEAPSLGKPVLVMRDVTERTEGIEAGTARLVGTTRTVIVAAARELLDDHEIYVRMAHSVNPYGDGKSSERIVRILRGTNNA